MLDCIFESAREIIELLIHLGLYFVCKMQKKKMLFFSLLLALNLQIISIHHQYGFLTTILSLSLTMINMFALY